MIKRNIEAELNIVATEYPVITVLGPRQSGKTTLVKAHFPTYRYCNLEDPQNRKLASDDPKALLKFFFPPVIFDEIQRVPELLSWIQVLVDKENTSGQFILTGSHQLKLRQTITQSLAGRTAILELLPFTINELKVAEINHDKEQFMCKGFLPRIYDKEIRSNQAYKNYFQTYVERDVRQLIHLKDITLFENFMRLLAARVGQLLNLEQLGNHLGVSGTTLKEWLSVLEASYIIFKLPPYYNNFGKRITKSSKYYFYEIGLAVWLLGIKDSKQAFHDPLHGSLFENMIIADILKEKLNKGEGANLYFWRDTNGNEVDLIIEEGRQLVPIEIKSSMTWNNKFTKGLKWFYKHIESSTKGYIIYAGDDTLELEDSTALNFKNLMQIV